jgi:hypothetical protein
LSAARAIKKVRGLSLLQKQIMAVAAKGWITPSEACECVEMQDDWGDDDTWLAKQAASASRALRRLVRRGLLVYCRPKYLAQSPAYRLPKFHGELPYNNSAHTKKAMYHSMNIFEPSESAQAVLTVRKEFDARLADRYQRSDTSLTKAEREYAKYLPNVAQREKNAKFLESHPTIEERLEACLTESQRALPEDLSVEDGRKVLVGILNRRRLTGNKELEAAR